MRPFHVAVGLVSLGLGLAGWAALGQAQPAAEPAAANRPIRVEPVVPGAPTRPLTRSEKPDERPAAASVRVIQSIESDIDVPAVRVPTPPGDSPRPDRAVKPTVFIPNPNAGTAPDSAPEPTAPVGPAARQDSAVRLEWHGPTVLRVGVPAEYTVVARNTSPVPLHKVMLQVKVPSGARVTGTEPKAEGTDNVLVWDHGSLGAREEKAVKVRMVPPGTGEMTCQAWVTVTGSAAVKVHVREPKLAVEVHAPEQITVGDPAPVVLVVSNPGDHPAEGVKLAVALGTGLEGAAGTKPLIAIGTLGAGQKREVKVSCVARAGGTYRCEALLEGDGGLKATGSTEVVILEPRLAVEVAGPKMRYLDRKAVYTITLTNPGDAPATQVSVSQTVPAGFKFVTADAGGRYDLAGQAVRWSVGELGAGETKELKGELMATGTGEFTHTVVAIGSRGVRAETTATTRVEGLSALSMVVIDSDDPVEVGTETTFEVRVTNTGSKDETDVKVVCNIPPQFQFKAATGPGRFEVVGGEVVFETLKTLKARTDVTYKVTLTAKEKGDARFKATLTAGGLSEPVIKQESTRVYAD